MIAVRYIKLEIRKDVLKLNKVCEKVLSRCSYTQSMRSLKDKVRTIFHRQKKPIINSTVGTTVNSMKLSKIQNIFFLLHEGPLNNGAKCSDFTRRENKLTITPESCG